MTFEVIAPYVSCLVYDYFDTGEENADFKEAVSAGYQSIYMITPSGILHHQAFRPGKDGANRFIRLKVDKIPGRKLRELSQQIQFLPAGKIPSQMLSQVKSFFKEVILKRGTAVEAMIWILWSQEKGYFLFVPNQRVSHASASYDWSGVPSGASIIVDIHSHADFGAFFSGTDNRDDSGSIRYSGVIGHNTSAKQSMVWRFNCQPSPTEVDASDIFDFTEQSVEVPSEWLEKVQPPPQVTRSTTIVPGGVYASYRSKNPAGQNGHNGQSSGLGKLGRVWTSKHSVQDHKDSRQLFPYGTSSDGIADSPGEDETYPWSKPDSSKKGKKSRSRKGSSQVQEPDVQIAHGQFVEEEGFPQGDPFAQAVSILSKKGLTADETLPDEGYDSYISKLIEDYGPDAAFAAQDIEVSVEQLKGCDDLLSTLTAKSFDAVSDDEKLVLFRRLYEGLPRKARETITTNGL